MCKAVSGAVVVICNLLFLPISIALLIFGALIKWNPSLLTNKIAPAILSEVNDEEAKKIATSLINSIVESLGGYGLVIFLFGLFLFLVSFCAVCGVCCKSKLLLGIYAVCLLLIFLALLIFTIVFAVRTSWFKERSAEVFKKAITEKYQLNNEAPSTGFTLWINTYQQKNHCCGSTGSADFVGTQVPTQRQYKVPASCCRNPRDQNCWSNPTEGNSFMNNGCNESFWKIIGQHFNYVLYGLCGLLAFTLALTIISIYLLVVYSRSELQGV